MATYKEAAEHVLTFGKYKDITIDEVACDDEGLRYLDWAKGANAGEIDDRVMISAYLNDPAIAKELKGII